MYENRPMFLDSLLFLPFRQHPGIYHLQWFPVNVGTMKLQYDVFNLCTKTFKKVPEEKLTSLIKDWKDYYDWRKIPLSSPVAIPLSVVKEIEIPLISLRFVSSDFHFLFLYFALSIVLLL